MVGIVMKLLPDSKALILDRMKGMTPLIQVGDLTDSWMYIALLSAYLSFYDRAIGFLCCWLFVYVLHVAVFCMYRLPHRADSDQL